MPGRLQASLRELDRAPKAGHWIAGAAAATAASAAGERAPGLPGGRECAYQRPQCLTDCARLASRSWGEAATRRAAALTFLVVVHIWLCLAHAEELDWLPQHRCGMLACLDAGHCPSCGYPHGSSCEGPRLVVRPSGSRLCRRRRAVRIPALSSAEEGRWPRVRMCGLVGLCKAHGLPGCECFWRAASWRQARLPAALVAHRTPPADGAAGRWPEELAIACCSARRQKGARPPTTRAPL